MIGFLFWVFLVVSLTFITIGIYYYVKEKKRQNQDENVSEVKIWGLRASTFYGISMASLIILFLLYEDPDSIKWDKQRKIDKRQNELIDSLLSENNRLKQEVCGLGEILELHNELDKQLINASGKRDVIIVNNRIPRPRHCWKDTTCCDSVRHRKVFGKK